MARSQQLVSRRRLAAAVLAAAALAAPRLAGAAPAPEGKFTPPGPPAASYGPDASRKCDATLLRPVLEELQVAAKRAGRPAPEPDGRLCAVADAFLAWGPGATPRPQVLAFVSQWYGLPEPVGTPIVAEFDIPDDREIAQRIVKSAAGTAALNAARPLVGIATRAARRGRYEKQTKVAIVVVDLPVEIQPVPRALAKGEKAKLAGKLVPGATKPRAFAADPAGKLSSTEPESGDAFELALECGERPGNILVEIRAVVNGSGALVSSFPVACGEPPPGAVAVAGEPWPTDAAAAEKKILGALNAQRQAAGLPPVRWDDAVARVARSIAEELASGGGQAGGAGLVDRLKKEGISSPVVLQSAAAERTFERAQDRILNSARDRATILSPEATLAGVGAFATTDPEGRPLVYVAEVLVKELPPIDPAAVRQQLRDAVAQKRKDARTSAVAPDATLDGVADRFAQALAAAGGTLPKEKAQELTAPLNKSFRTVTMISGAKQEPLDFAEEPQATAPGKALGVGVAQGAHPVLGRNAVYVVLMVGTPRGAGADETAATPKKKKATATRK
ncbi:MAG TPA: CAP domain-containing protein [Anaeromyxobacter sp.]|nr:CAP domain-containing protein [Anaeromyxobacter sp.]